MIPKKHVPLEKCILALAPIIGDTSVDKKDVVLKPRPARVAAVPLSEKQQREILRGTNVEGVVVETSVGGAPAEMDDPRGVDAVVLANVIPDNGTFVERVAGGTNQEEPALVVVAVVILEYGATAPIVRVEALTILDALHSCDFVELNHRVVTVERPNPGRIIVASGAAATQRVTFNQCPVAAPDLDSVTADILQQVSTNHHPEASGTPGSPLANPVSVGPQDVAILNQ